MLPPFISLSNIFTLCAAAQPAVQGDATAGVEAPDQGAHRRSQVSEGCLLVVDFLDAMVSNVHASSRGFEDLTHSQHENRRMGLRMTTWVEEYGDDNDHVLSKPFGDFFEQESADSAAFLNGFLVGVVLVAPLKPWQPCFACEPFLPRAGWVLVLPCRSHSAYSLPFAPHSIVQQYGNMAGDSGGYMDGAWGQAGAGELSGTGCHPGTWSGGCQIGGWGKASSQAWCCP